MTNQAVCVSQISLHRHWTALYQQSQQVVCESPRISF